MLSAIGLVTSFSSTLMFTALGSFFNRVSDPGEVAAPAHILSREEGGSSSDPGCLGAEFECLCGWERRVNRLQ